VSATVNLFPGLRITADNTDPCIWVRTNHDSVSITFDSPEQIAAMRAALSVAEALLREQRAAA
jgi:hypothetical protein